MAERDKKRWGGGPAACLLAMALATLAGCNKSTSPLPWNISGSWFIVHDVGTTAGELGPEIFTFTTSENSLSGTTPLGLALTGTVNDLAVSFHWKAGDGSVFTYTGQIGTDGETLAGSWTSSKGPSGTWHGIVDSAPLAAVGGTWNFFTTTNGATGEEGPSLVTLTQTSSTLTGRSPNGATISGDTGLLKILLAWVRGDGTTVVFLGDVASGGATMSGTWSGNRGQSGTWRATKKS